ncbi:hypothetical protein [Sphingobium sp. CFD-2]|uniref:hypothetical protein n=1 Tax=Sphingobium sp. CFD-2 TaxID=2878542 RepID=UPI00214AFD46|nr:hypothetical protein [Sphingobium sp. CFD-2]
MSASSSARQLREIRIDRILDMIEQAAANDQPCPTNRVLCKALGVSSVATVSAMVELLEKRGLIKVERMSDARIAEIVATGRKTATPAKWGIVASAGGCTRNKTAAARFDDVLAETGSIERAGAAIGLGPASAHSRFSRIRKELGWQAQ